jgi:hypothetical protein
VSPAPSIREKSYAPQARLAGCRRLYTRHRIALDADYKLLTGAPPGATGSRHYAEHQHRWPPVAMQRSTVSWKQDRGVDPMGLPVGQFVSSEARVSRARSPLRRDGSCNPNQQLHLSHCSAPATNLSELSIAYQDMS